MFRLCALVGIEHSLCWGGWGPGLRSVSPGKVVARGTEGTDPGAEAGSGPAPTRPGGGACLLFSLLVAVRSAEAWGSRAATRLRRWGASGAGGSGARSGDASKRRTDRRGHRPGVSALEFDIHLSRVYPPPFFLKHFFLTVFFSVLIYFCFPFPTKSGRPFGEIALLLPPKITSDSGNGQRRKRVARAPKRSEGRERDRVRERALTSETREGQGQSE